MNKFSAFRKPGFWTTLRGFASILRLRGSHHRCKSTQKKRTRKNMTKKHWKNQPRSAAGQTTWKLTFQSEVQRYPNSLKVQPRTNMGSQDGPCISILVPRWLRSFIWTSKWSENLPLRAPKPHTNIIKINNKGYMPTPCGVFSFRTFTLCMVFCRHDPSSNSQGGVWDSKSCHEITQSEIDYMMKTIWGSAAWGVSHLNFVIPSTNAILLSFSEFQQKTMISCAWLQGGLSEWP